MIEIVEWLMHLEAEQGIGLIIGVVMSVWLCWWVWCVWCGLRLYRKGKEVNRGD